MKNKLEKLSDKELIELAVELNEPSFDKDSKVRKIIGDVENFPIRLIELNVVIVQVLAKRLKDILKFL